MKLLKLKHNRKLKFDSGRRCGVLPAVRAVKVNHAVKYSQRVADAV